ncbi:MAG: uroporphyrinogen decarboxylase family protein, partial [Syntrophales bacterium]|nr:uroporphyrinogen decarboxylase family protein [Syntrophales bacterium]
DFLEFGFPYFKDLYAADVAVKFFHNDAPCAPSIGHYADIGIQLFNPGIQHTIDELKEMCGNRLTLLHGIPPRDVLALGTPADVSAAARRLLAETADHSRLILSCAGGMPPDVSSANLRAFIDATRLGNLQAS